MLKPRILIVEDNPIVAADIESLILEQKNYLISGMAHDASSAFDILANRIVDLVLLDINLGTGPSGIDIAKIINEKYELPFIFLTAFSDEHTLTAASDLGPSGYLVKPFNDRGLLATIAVAIRNAQSRPQKESITSAFPALTGQEVKILELVLIGYSNKKISDNINLSVNTVKFHLKNIYVKSQVNSKQELLAIALKKIYL